MLNVGNQRLVHHPAGQRELEERHRQRVFMCVGGEALKRGGGMLSVKYFPILLAFFLVSTVLPTPALTS